MCAWEDEGPFLEEARKRVTVARKLEAELNKLGDRLNRTLMEP